MGKVKSGRKMKSPLPSRAQLPTRVQPEVMPRPGMVGVYTNQIHAFKKHVLDELPKKQFASYFMKPVDTKKLRVPNYYNIVRNPMDVGSITKRVKNNYYRHVDQAIEDFNLMINNCFLFNSADSLVYRKGLQLEMFFRKNLHKIPKGPPVPFDMNTETKTDSMTEAMEKECREVLEELQISTSKGQSTARKFFGPKWVSLSKKLDKHLFKSAEEFRSQVHEIFKKYNDCATNIYEKVYNQPGPKESLSFISTIEASTSAAALANTAAFNSTSSNAQPGSSTAQPGSSMAQLASSLDLPPSFIAYSAPGSVVGYSVPKANDFLQHLQRIMPRMQQSGLITEMSKAEGESLVACLVETKAKLYDFMATFEYSNVENNSENPSTCNLENNSETPTTIAEEIQAHTYISPENLRILLNTNASEIYESLQEEEEQQRSLQTDN